MEAFTTKKQVSILGLGETGLASSLFLKKRGYCVFVSDRERSEILEKRAKILEDAGIPYELGKHSLEKIGASDWVLISPGIPPTAEIYQELRRKDIPLVSEPEVASWFSPGEVIAVTGTSGKSTVTTLIHRLLEANGRLSVACGNLGNPWIGEIERLTPESHVVLEISSFQLVHTASLRPPIAALLNVGFNHLDWHPSLEAYVQAKLRLFQNQTAEDFSLVRERDRKIFFPDFVFQSRLVSFGEKEEEDANEALLDAVTRLKGLDPAKTREVLARFEGLEHRLEKVAQIDGIAFVNDSKCTTLEALVWGMDRFPEGRVILLAGGHAKGADFRLVRDRIARKIKEAIVFGEARELLWESWGGAFRLTRSQDLRGAFQEALKVARPGDTVLLSPACASFDQFSNYKERGRLFKELVAQTERTALTSYETEH